MKDIPQLDEKVLALTEKIYTRPDVQAAMKLISAQTDLAMEEQIELCEIESPTFHEQERANSVAERMRKYGLTDVRIDEAGNVIGVRKGSGNGPVLAIGAHMDSVFAAGTDVKVRREGNIYRAPGIGDNCSGLRALLQVLRALEAEKIETVGDIWFVGTVGEEGNGDIKGSKYLCANNKLDGFVAIDSTDVGRVLYGAVGSHRWRLSVDGPGGHSFTQFGKVPSAIHAVCRAGSKVVDIKVPVDPKTTFTIGTIKGGSTVNTISAHCEVEVDIRSVSNEELIRVEEKILSAFEKAVEEENACWGVSGENVVKLTKTMIGNRPGGLRPHTCPVLQSARSAQKLLGIELTNYGMSSTDANAPMSHNIPSTCLCSGGKGIGAHTLNEYFVMERTELGPQLILLTALALAGTDSTSPLL